MVKHMIIWKLREELSDSEKQSVKENAKAALEGLYGTVPELLSVSVQINGLPSSAGDMLLDTSFESAEDLAAYQIHPAHVDAANRFVRPFAHIRLSYDYEV